MKILYVIGTLDIGGAEGQLVELVTRLDRNRFDPVVCCLASGGDLVDRLRQCGIHVEVVGLQKPAKRGGLSLAYGRDLGTRARRFFEFVRGEHPDVVHGMLFWGYTLGALAARRADGAAIVASRRSLSHFKRGKPHYAWLERLTNRLTDVFVANSDAVRRDVLAEERVADARIRVIYNGLDPAKYDVSADTALRETVGVSAGVPVVVVVANFIHYKGHHVFLDAWRSVIERRPDAIALLIGEGPTRRTCEAQAERLGIARSIRFLGSRDDVAALLALASIVVHPSFQEGFCNAIIEAMAASKPVVATAVGGNPEAVVEGRTGRLVPAGDAGAMFEAMMGMIDAPERAAAMGAEGRRRIEQQFSIDRTVRQYEMLYDELDRSAAASR